MCQLSRIATTAKAGKYRPDAPHECRKRVSSVKAVIRYSTTRPGTLAYHRTPTSCIAKSGSTKSNDVSGDCEAPQYPPGRAGWGPGARRPREVAGDRRAR